MKLHHIFQFNGFFSPTDCLLSSRQAEAGGSGIMSRRVTGQPSGAEQFVMMIPNNKVKFII